MGQFLVGCLFLIQRLIEERRGIVAAQLLGPSDQRPVPSHLVMLDCLRCGNHRRIEDRFVLHFAGDVLGLFDYAVDGWTIDALRLFADQLDRIAFRTDLPPAGERFDIVYSSSALQFDSKGANGSDARWTLNTSPPKALIAPHARYACPGQVACGLFRSRGCYS